MPAAVDLAGMLEILQHGFQRDAVGALDAEGARDLALADGNLGASDIVQNLLARGELSPFVAALGHRAPLLMGRRFTGP